MEISVARGLFMANKFEFSPSIAVILYNTSSLS